MLDLHRFYSKIYLNSSSNISDVGTEQCLLPHFSEEALIKICDLAIVHLNKQPTLLTLEGDYTVVGDIHGNIHDLLRILKQNGSPGKTKYIFLGDYVDRGSYSVEVISLLLSLMIIFPKNVYLLRGNHEILSTNRIYGFYDEIIKNGYTITLYNKFNAVFDYMSLAAVLNNESLLLHGGIGPNVKTLSSISSIAKPVPLNDVVNEILWSDPEVKATNFAPNTLRGQGFFFGSAAARNFLMRNNLKRLIRGHQVETTGIGSFDDNRVLTVFSSSCYCGRINACAVIHIRNNRVISESYPPMRKPARMPSAPPPTIRNKITPKENIPQEQQTANANANTNTNTNANIKQQTTHQQQKQQNQTVSNKSNVHPAENIRQQQPEKVRVQPQSQREYMLQLQKQTDNLSVKSSGAAPARMGQAIHQRSTSDTSSFTAGRSVKFVQRENEPPLSPSIRPAARSSLAVMGKTKSQPLFETPKEETRTKPATNATASKLKNPMTTSSPYLLQDTNKRQPPTRTMSSPYLTKRPASPAQDQKPITTAQSSTQRPRSKSPLKQEKSFKNELKNPPNSNLQLTSQSAQRFTKSAVRIQSNSQMSAIPLKTTYSSQNRNTQQEIPISKTSRPFSSSSPRFNIDASSVTYSHASNPLSARRTLKSETSVPADAKTYTYTRTYVK